MQPTSQPSAEPSVQPSSAPSSPTSQPSMQPSMQPTSQPSAVPSVQPSSAPSSPSSQPTSEPSMQPTSQPSAVPSVQPSSAPSSPSTQPTSEPSMQPTTQPSAVPSVQPSSAPSSPSSQPTSEPSMQPSGVPSGQPSSLPTTLYPQSLFFIGGGSESSPVVWDVQSLGYVNNSEPIYLSVDIYPTNYENKANQYATVKVNGVTLLLHCTPDESCGSEWYSCIADVDVSSYRLEPMGGSMAIQVSSSGVNTGPCDYLSYPLYTRMYLRGAFPTSQPSSQPTSLPSSYPSGEPSSCPSSSPSTHPSSSPVLPATPIPSSQPSTQPTSEPTAQPSSYPTASPPFWMQTCAGGDDAEPLIFNLTQLGFANVSGPLYLGVSVFPTNFEVRGSQWASVTVNGDELIPFCVPDASCGTEMYYCLVNLDVRSRLQSPFGGSLQVVVSSTGVNGGPCDYEGFPLYSCVQIGDYIPSSEENLLPSIWVMAAVGCLILIVLLIVGCYCRSSMKVEPEKPSRYALSDGNGHFDGGGVDVEFRGGMNARHERLQSPSGGRSKSSRDNGSEDFSSRRLKLQASGRFSNNDDYDMPLRPLRGSGRKKRQSDDGGVEVEDTEERIEKSLKQARSVKKVRKSYSFDDF
jgi:hypothetical protein